MTFERLVFISRALLALTAAAFAVSAAMFLKLRIPEAFDIITGRAMKKAAAKRARERDRRAQARERGGRPETAGEPASAPRPAEDQTLKLPRAAVTAALDPRTRPAPPVFQILEDITYTHADPDIIAPDLGQKESEAPII